MQRLNDDASPEVESVPRRTGAWRRRGGKLLLIAASVFVALLIGEVIIRLLPRTWVPELLSYEAVEFHLSKDLVQPSHNPNLYYELVPDSPRNDVNRDGYRGPHYSVEKPPGVLRIVGIGDSNMFAWQLPEAQGYLRQLERLCNERSETETTRQADKQNGPTRESPPPLVSPSPPPQVQVINLAVPGYNSAEHLEVLRSRALAFEPDLIILGYDHNDAEPIASDDADLYLMPDDYGNNLLGSQLIRWAWRKSWVLRMRWQLSNPGGNQTATPTLPFTPAYYCGGPFWDRHFKHHREMAHLLRDPARVAQSTGPASRTVPVLVFIHDPWIVADPRRQSDHYRLLHEPLHGHFAALGWHVVDGYDVFQNHMQEHGRTDLMDLWLQPRLQDGHPNARAHRLIAAALYNAIRREQLLPTAVPEG